jgi:TPR repeat protein
MKTLLTIILLLTFGAGVWGNTAEQIAKFREAAENGNASVQWLLAYAYKDGDGVPKDEKESIKWYRKAAEQGHADAQYNLGFFYYNGDGVPESYVQTYAWFNIAVANGLEKANKVKTAVAGLMTKEQIAEAQKLSREMVEATPKLMGD